MAKRRPKRQPKKLAIDVVEARAFVLVDEYGTQRAGLQSFNGDGSTDGAILVQLNDARGEPRLEVLVDKDGNPGVRFLNSNGSPAISIAANQAGGNGFTVCDAKGRPCIMIGIPGEESLDPRGLRPDITVVDYEDKRMWSSVDGLTKIPDDEDRPG